MGKEKFTLLELLPEAVIIANGGGKLEFANQRALDLFGYPRAEMVGQSLDTLVPDRFRSAHVGQRATYMETPSIRPMESGLEILARRKDGTEFPVDISLAPLSTAEGTWVVATVHDMTGGLHAQERMEALHEIAVSSIGLDPLQLGRVVVERTRGLLRGDDATLLCWDAKKNNLQIVADTFGRPFSRDVAIGEGTAGIAFEQGSPVAVEDYAGWEHAVPDALARGMKSVIAVPLMVRDRPVGALTVSFTTPRRFQKEDLYLLTLLAAQVGPALEAARLHDTVLHISSELKDASVSKSRFLAGMSHELRTPLNAIIGFSELLANEPAGGYEQARRVQFLDQIHKAGVHLLALINDILDLSKVETGQMELHLTSFDVAGTVKATIETVAPLVNQKQLNVHVEMSDGMTLYADEGKFRQMLLNLLSNAIKFTAQGGSVTVSARQLGEEVIVCVADTGIGITARDQARLFVEFQQLDQGAGGHQPGTGLGLALTRRLAELHGGRVWVESELGSGSRFFIALPVLNPTYVSANAGIETGQQPAGPLVMVVEDQESAAAILSFTLKRAGYRVEQVRQGSEVLQEAIRLRPRAITLDILLPDRDGWDILRALKSSPETRDIPVLVVSILDDRSVGLALGADDYLVKPVAREALLDFMARHGLAGRADERSVRVLAVDDDPQALLLLKEALDPRFTMLTASNGSTGIAMARSERPDVVILDLMLPGMSGFEVASTLKVDPATRHDPDPGPDRQSADRRRQSAAQRPGESCHAERCLRRGRAAEMAASQLCRAPGSQDEMSRILIVDNEPADALLLETILGDIGSSIRSVTDSRQAEQTFADFEPDLVLLDLHMADPDGLEILRRLSGLRSQMFVPVVVLTADATKVARQSALVLGADDFLTKPFDQFEVRLRVRNLLRTRALYVELAEAKAALEGRLRQQK